ncbi:MAPEG family protein [Altererythrobacter sp. ZODW24]|uniref:MAPEG family protein n=1 Tax=Altererythrobacter sp. ZODW24 TaxID=2185142 RepID=UPI000DF8376F|nr:MAPEG family protein [Altererythrobacter sp. ZODW24]
MLLPVTLTATAAAGILTIWLMIRIGAIRRAEEISVGDGGNEALIRRMRAQMNFVETTPFALFLIAAIEIAGKGGNWLAFVAGIFMLGRIAHAFGMDGTFGKGRFIGTIVTLLTLLGLAVVAALVAMGVI